MSSLAPDINLRLICGIDKCLSRLGRQRFLAGICQRRDTGFDSGFKRLSFRFRPVVGQLPRGILGAFHRPVFADAVEFQFNIAIPCLLGHNSYLSRTTMPIHAVTAGIVPREGKEYWRARH